MGYTGEGKDRNVWTGRLGVTELDPVKGNDLTTKKYVDDNTGFPELNEVTNPTTSKTFNFGNEKSLTFSSVDRTPVGNEGTFNFEGTGNFTGDLVHIHQHTGNAGVGTVLLRVESADTNVTPIDVTKTGTGSVFSVDLDGNVATSGTVDGIDIATDVAANTLKNTDVDHNVTTNLSAGTRAPTTIDVNSSDGTNATLIEADTTNAGILGSDKWDEIVANTSAKHTQNTDTAVANNAITLAMMAHGTDGNLITYDADGAPAAVATGDATQVLTSNGVGTAPTFQAAAGGGSATKEFIVQAQENPADDGPVGWMETTNLVATEICYFTFHIPHDYTSLTECKILFIPDATETVQWDCTAEWSAVGEAVGDNLGEAMTDETDSVVDNTLYEVDISTTFTGTPQAGSAPAANDWVGVRFDSNTTQMRVVGLRFKYT